MRRILVLMCFAGLLSIHAFGQQSGQILGLVTDTSGAVIPGITVSATETGTGFSRSTITREDGRYVLTALQPTKYELAAEAPGFRTFKRSGMELLANQSLTVNITLEVGEISQTVEVVGNAIQVDTTTSVIKEVVDHSRIVELPLNGRDAARLSALVPGVAVVSVSTETGKSIPGGLRLSSNGSQGRQVAFRLDGVSNTDFYFQENQTSPAPDFLQEFSIQSSNYSAAHGNNAGAVVNIVTRSGTNDFHGGVFEFVRNRVFNARNFFARERDFLKRNQYGAFAGGPVKLPGYDGKNKTFFFGGWQGTIIKNRANDVTAFAPTSDQRRGNFGTTVVRDPQNNGQPFPGNQIPVTRFDPVAVNVLKFMPEVGGDGRIVFGRNISQDLNQVVSKIDHQLTNKDRVSGRYFIDHFDNAAIYNDGNLLTYRGGSNQSRVRTQNTSLSWTRTFTPTLLNEFHFGYNRVHSRRAPPNGAPGMKELGVRLPVYPTLASIAQIEAVGFFNIGDNLEAKFVRNGFEWNNQTSWVIGRHSIAFGGELARYRVDIVNEFRRAGHYVFRPSTTAGTGNQIADFLLGYLDTFDQGTGEYKNNRATYAALFLQDDMKLSSRLTMNLGLRYEPTPPWHEQAGRIERFRLEDFAAGVRSQKFLNAPPGVTFRGDPGVPRDGVLPDFNNLGGRFGFAWDVNGNGKTSIRGGGGMFYDQHLQGDFNNGGVNAPPWSLRVSVTRPPGTLADPYRGRSDFSQITIAAIGDANAPFPRPVLLTTYDDRHQTPLTYNWNLTLEREILPEWLARVAYVASASNYGRITKQFNAARYIPGSTLGTDARRLLAPEIGNVDYFTEDRRSNYHSMQLSLTKRMSHGFTILTNYTLSKGLGNYGDEVAPHFVPGADKLMYGPMEFDHKHRFVGSWVLDLPSTSTNNVFLRGLLNGWQATGIGQYQTGAPYTVQSGTDNSRTGINRDRAKRTGISPTPAAGSDKTVWFNPAAFGVNDIGTFGEVGAGAYYGPKLFNFDMGFFKSFRSSERVSTQFRAEFFNIFNQVNFDNPNIRVTGGGFGVITKTHPNAGEPRIIQFGLKLLF